jgi:hypothetical protein
MSKSPKYKYEDNRKPEVTEASLKPYLQTVVQVQFPDNPRLNYVGILMAVNDNTASIATPRNGIVPCHIKFIVVNPRVKRKSNN